MPSAIILGVGDKPKSRSAPPPPPFRKSEMREEAADAKAPDMGMEKKAGMGTMECPNCGCKLALTPVEEQYEEDQEIGEGA
jgi:hypothetical protein